MHGPSVAVIIAKRMGKKGNMPDKSYNSEDKGGSEDKMDMGDEDEGGEEGKDEAMLECMRDFMGALKSGDEKKALKAWEYLMDMR